MNKFPNILTLVLCATVLQACWLQASAQTKYITRTGAARFVADGIVKDDVQARSNTVSAILVGPTGQVQVRIPVNSFVFRKALMQEHFNENYLESHKHPDATFVGKIADWNENMLQKSGVQKIRFVGTLKIHGVSKEIQEPGTLEMVDGQAALTTDFMVTVADYGIAIPPLVKDKIAKEASVHVEARLKP